MENQDSNLFGIQSSSTLDSDLADLMFGGTDPKADPKTIQPLVTKIETDEDIKEPKSPFIETVELSVDDVLNDIDELEPKVETPAKKVDPAKPEETKTEPVVNTEDDTFTVLSKNLIDLGIFNQNDDEELPKNAEEFKDKWVAERQNQVNDDLYNFLMSKHGEEGFKVFQDIFVNGVDPKEYLSKYAEITDFKSLDMTVESNQEQVVRKSLRNQGMKDDIIDKKIQKMKDYGDLEEEASIAHELISRQEEESQTKKAAEKAHEEQLKAHQKVEERNRLQTLLMEKVKAKEFDGIPVTDKVAREILDYMDTEKWQLPTGEKLTDLDKEYLEMRNNPEMRLKFALLMRNKLDLSKIKTNLVSKETNKYFNDLVIKDKNVKRTQQSPITGGFFDGL